MLLHALFWATGGRLHPCITLWNKARSTRIYVWMLELERVITHARHVSMQPGRTVVFLCLDPSIELIVGC